MENLDYIESYFKNELPAEEKTQFEQKIINDKNFAEEVAFYCSATQIIKNELNADKKNRFKEIYQQKNIPHQSKGIVRKIWTFSAAAAAIIAIVFGWHFFAKPVSTQQLADEYIKQHFQTLGVSMSSRQDSIETGKSLYNDGKLPEALQQFEKSINTNGESFEAKEYAGIVSLKLKNYDKALAYFSQIENDTVFSNPSKMYKAITLMERNNAGDKEQAKELLQQIIQNNLDEKETAEQWLKKW
ncbi:MAG TPA: tetratricopeptide repeat protein [Puia sp.]|jgi:tetratricopeptide (TPR) repeat protein|nr:tetratricopeptide repeat protein [Puia sp.]